MDLQEINTEVGINCTYCPLQMYGCTDSFAQDQITKHYLSAIHLESIIKFICLEKLNNESALIDLMIDPRDINERVSSAKSKKYLKFIERLTCLIVETDGLPNSATIASNILPIPISIEMLMRNLIQQTDRDPNHNFNLRSLQDQNQLNEIVMNQIANRIDSSFDQEDTYRRTERGEQHQNLSSINEHNNIRSCMYSNGILIWPIEDIFKKIEDAICRKQPFIDSPWFQTSTNGHRLWARLHLNGKIDPKFISFNIHLTSSINNPFLGHIKFILVDRSTNHPLNHMIKHFYVTENMDSYCFGFDNFIDKNMLHGEPNPYVHNDSVYFLVCVEQINHEKFTNLEPNIKDAMLQSY